MTPVVRMNLDASSYTAGAAVGLRGAAGPTCIALCDLAAAQALRAWTWAIGLEPKGHHLPDLYARLRKAGQFEDYAGDIRHLVAGLQDLVDRANGPTPEVIQVSHADDALEISDRIVTTARARIEALAELDTPTPA